MELMLELILATLTANYIADAYLQLQKQKQTYKPWHYRAGVYQVRRQR